MVLSPPLTRLADTLIGALEVCRLSRVEAAKLPRMTPLRELAHILLPDKDYVHVESAGSRLTVSNTAEHLRPL